MKKFLIVHYNELAVPCLNLLSSRPPNEVRIAIVDPRPLSDFRSAIRKFKRLSATCFMGTEPKQEADYHYDYVVLCGPEDGFTKKMKGERLTPVQLAEMFPGLWADALLRAIPLEATY